MERILLNQLKGESRQFDDCVKAMGGIDTFCSSSFWGIAAAKGLMGPREDVICKHDAGYITLMKNVYPDGLRVLEPLEAMWGLGASVIGDEKESGLVLVELLDSLGDSWDALVLTGFEKASFHFRSIVQALSKDYKLQLGAEVGRHQASLTKGFDDYWSKRPRQHRKNLRQIEKNMPFDVVDGSKLSLEEAITKIIDVERRSWKGIERVGIEASQLIDFYKAMLRMMWPLGMVELLFVKDGLWDVGFILGAVFNRIYRGLQFAYDANYRTYGLGHYCQWMQLQRLSRDVDVYDLGTEGLDYKKKWSDTVVRTINLHVFR